MSNEEDADGIGAVVCAWAVVAAAHVALGQPAAPVIPLVPGLTIVLAAHNTLPPNGKESTIVRMKLLDIDPGDSRDVLRGFFLLIRRWESFQNLAAMLNS
jgi:hypothetical protein